MTADRERTEAPRRVLYLINRYPKASHSFVRREIHGLERAGIEVVRVSVRAAREDVVDPLDVAEAERTHVVLSRGALRLAATAVAAALRAPARFGRALKRAITLGWRSDRGLLVHLVYLVEACELVRLCRAHAVDHVHAHFGTNPPAVALLGRVLGGPPYSFTVHGPEEFDRPRALKLSEKIADARFVVAVSEFGRSQLYRWSAHEDWAKITVVHCGVDDVFLARSSSPPPAAPRLVCVGRLCEEKGQLLLVEAAAALARDGIDFELAFVGDGELRAAIERLAERLGIAARVRITGWLAGAAVRSEIERARALVLPSFAEGLPVVLMEALALERPVISTYVAGIPELVVHGECGWLAPAGDLAALGRCLRAALAATPERLAEMGRAGAARVRSLHDATSEAAKLAERLREDAA